MICKHRFYLLCGRQEVLASNKDDVNKYGRHEFPKVVANYSSSDEEAEIIISKKNTDLDQKTNSHVTDNKLKSIDAIESENDKSNSVTTSAK